jgi:hypothetical protein
VPLLTPSTPAASDYWLVPTVFGTRLPGIIEDISEQQFSYLLGAHLQCQAAAAEQLGRA